MHSSRSSKSRARASGNGAGGRVGGRVGGRGFRGQHIPSYIGGRGHERPPREIAVSMLPSVPSPPHAAQQSTPQVQAQTSKGIDKRRNQHDVIWGNITVLTVSDILHVGLTYVGFDAGRQSTVCLNENKERFREHYGVPPEAVVPMFNDLRDKFPDLQYKKALMTLHWLKAYPTERQLSGTWGYGDLKLIRETCKDYARKMASLKEKKIVFGGFDEDETFVFGVDGVHFQTQEFRLTPSSKWFDFKSNSSGLKYEFAMAIRRPAIVWMRGPFPASTHDITIFRGGKENKKEKWSRNSLYFAMQELGEGKMGIGDSGYGGESEKIATTNYFFSKEFKEFLARVKNREESLHIRLKAYNILENRFRHGKSTEDKMELHGVVVTAITVITQYDFENGRPPFEVQ